MTEAYYNSDICQKCANCCTALWMYVKNPDVALRFSWLDTNVIQVTKIKEDIWKILFKIPCKQLEFKDGKYWCKAYNANRPSYCRTFPMNFNGDDKDIIEDIRKVCPLIKIINLKS